MVAQGLATGGTSMTKSGGAIDGAHPPPDRAVVARRLKPSRPLLSLRHPSLRHAVRKPPLAACRRQPTRR
jgi:hypothetical protein